MTALPSSPDRPIGVAAEALPTEPTPLETNSPTTAAACSAAAAGEVRSLAGPLAEATHSAPRDTRDRPPAQAGGPVRIHVVTGFLGSGKTTLLRHLLDQGLGGERVAVLVNEFGEVGIDGGLLRRSGQPVVELDSGCICCEVGADMLDTLHRMMADYHPDRIVFELSGLAEPGSVLAALSGRAVVPGSLRLEPTICVVDAKSYGQLSAELEYGYWNQIQAADIVLVNKVDGLDAPTLRSVLEQLQACSPSALLMPCVHCKVELPAVFDTGLPSTTRMGGAEHADHGHPHNHLRGFESWVLRDPTTVFERSRVERFLGRLEGGVFRVKGTVRCREGCLFVSWVRSGASWEVAAPSDPEPTTLVCIGRALDREALRDGLADCAARARRGISLGGQRTLSS
jgi:G3E family GTPase